MRVALGRVLLPIPIVFISFGGALQSEPLTVVPPESVGMSSNRLAAIDETMHQMIADGQPAGCVVIVARRGKVVYFKSFGHRDKEAQKPMVEDTIVRLYSMSKAITSAAALMLWEEGKLDLDAPVSKYVPALANVEVWTPDGLAAPKRAMTVRDLMRHTSGLAMTDAEATDAVGKAYNESKLGDAKDLDEFAEKVAKLPLACHPGEKMVYSVSIDILGLIVQKASGQDLGVFLRERLFEPLGMVDTAFYVPAEKRDRLARFYVRSEEERGLKPYLGKVVDEVFYEKPALLRGGQGLVGTAGDYMRFLLMIANGGEWNGKRYLKAETVALMTTDQLPSTAERPFVVGGVPRDGSGFGLGFSVRVGPPKNFDLDAHLGEYRWGGGASTHYWVSPNDDNLIVVTMEQVFPVSNKTRFALKPVVYDAIEN